MVERAHHANTDVIFVRNNGTIGDPDEPNTPGWDIHPALSPYNTDLIIIDKHTPDSFHNTHLQDILHVKDITHLIVAGMQTEGCLNATCQRAVELGYDVSVVADAHSTFDLENMTAAQAIRHYNTEFSAIAAVKNVIEIVFE
ncbi:MAG: isochorismatase family protein [bacterium]|nr:isochorismatase family protein [bacterium]